MRITSDENIACNVLAERLKRLAQAGQVTRAADPTHSQKGIYRPTEPAIQLASSQAQ